MRPLEDGKNYIVYDNPFVYYFPVMCSVGFKPCNIRYFCVLLFKYFITDLKCLFSVYANNGNSSHTGSGRKCGNGIVIDRAGFHTPILRKKAKIEAEVKVKRLRGFLNLILNLSFHYYFTTENLLIKEDPPAFTLK